MTVLDLKDPCREHGGEWPFHDTGFSRGLPMGAWWDGEIPHASLVVVSTILGTGNTVGAVASRAMRNQKVLGNRQNP